MVGHISIYKDNSFDIKIKIYYQIIGVISKNKYNKRYLSDKFLGLHFEN